MSKVKKSAATPTDGNDATEAEIKRMTEVFQELSKKAPIQVAPYVKQAAPYLAIAVVYIMLALPYIAKACTAAQELIAGVPEKIIYASLGFLMCFFGGIFPVTIAAVEAWRLCGGKEALACLNMLYKEALKVHAANKEDEEKEKENDKDEEKEKDNDNDKDAKTEAIQLTPQELIAKKAQVVLKAVEPETISHGVVGLYTGWIGVLAILKIKFAKTVTLGERIGEEIYRRVKTFEPMVEEMVDEEYRKWVPVAIRWTCKATAVSIAWWIQRVISAVHSAIRGGLVFGKYLVEFLHEKKILNNSAKQAYLDEVIGWSCALAGLIFQFGLGFGLPFPLSLLLWPMRLIETFIVWSVAA